MRAKSKRSSSAGPRQAELARGERVRRSVVADLRQGGKKIAAEARTLGFDPFGGLYKLPS